MSTDSVCLFHSFFNNFNFEDFITRRTQQKDFDWLHCDTFEILDSISDLNNSEDASNLIDSLQDGCLGGEDEEPDETEDFIRTFEEAEMNFRQGKFEKALALYGKAQKELPLISKTYLKLSVTFTQVDRLEQAVACAIAAFMLSPHDVHSESLYAMGYSKLGYVDIGNKFISENPQCEEANYVRAVIRGLKPGARRRFDDEDLERNLQELINCIDAKDKATLRCVFLLYHIRYHQWLNPQSKLKIAQCLIKFLAENQLIAKICAAVVHDFKAAKHAALCVLFSLFCLLVEICQDDESIAVKLWSSPAVRMFLSKIGIQITRDDVIISTVQHMGVFGRAVIVTYIDLIAAFVKHPSVRSQMCKMVPFNEVLWYGLTQVVYFRVANAELFRHAAHVEHKLPVLCLACSDGKLPKQLTPLEALTEFLHPSIPPFEFVGKFFAIFPLLVEYGEILTSLETFIFASLEYTTHVFSVLSAIGFYAELEDTRLTKNCAMLTPFWVKMTSMKKVAKACGADVWFFFARKLKLYSRNASDVFKDFKIDLTQTFDVLLNLSGVDDFPEIEHIDQSFSYLADSLCLFIDNRTAPKSTPLTFANEITCKALTLLNCLSAKSPSFLKKLTVNALFSLSHIVLQATPISQQREPSQICSYSLKLLATLLKKSPTLPSDLLRFNEISTSFIVEVLFFMATKTKGLDFIASACLCLTRIASASKKCKMLVANSVKSCSVRQEILIGKLVNLIDSSLGSGEAKKLAQKDRLAVLMTIASFLAVLSEMDATFRTALVCESKFHNAVSRLQSCMSDLSL